MLTLITGAPGSGKSAAMVRMLFDAEKAGRAIYVDGVPDLTIAHTPLEDPRRWMDCPDGALIVIDEVQRIWRPAGAGAKVPPDVEQLETHRHRGFDFILVTQHPNLLHQNVRRLVGRHIHIRDVGILGRWWYEWPEATNPETFRTAPTKKRYKVDPKVMGAYKSASLHIKPVRSIPPVVILAGVAVVALAALVWMGIKNISSRITPEKPVVPGAPVTSGYDSQAKPQAPQATKPQQAKTQTAIEPRNPQFEPLQGFGVHYLGRWLTEGRETAYFSLSRGGRRVGIVQGADLNRAGYSVRYVGPCVAVLGMHGMERVAVCDTPPESPTPPRAGPAASAVGA